MKPIKYTILLTIILFYCSSFAQETNKITTVILIRHAEKVSDGSKNPELTNDGKERAIRFMNLFKNSGVSTIYSTDFKRTVNTVSPIADVLNLKIEMYDPFDKNFTTNILEKHNGETIVVIGHSNTTPQLVNQLIGVDKHSSLSDDEYGKIYIVSATNKGDSKVVELSY